MCTALGPGSPTPCLQVSATCVYIHVAMSDKGINGDEGRFQKLARMVVLLLRSFRVDPPSTSVRYL